MDFVKRIIAVITICVIIAFALPSAYADETSGHLSTGALWKFDSATGTLTVYGDGRIPDWGPQESRWHDMRQSIKKVDIQSGVTGIGSHAFYFFENMTELTIGDTVGYINDNAFMGCSSLKKVVIPDSVKTLEEYCFEQCEALETVAVGNSVTEIPKNAFRNCSSLKTAFISDSVKKIGYCAFEGCEDMESVVLSKNLTEIEAYAFAQCRSLQSIELPAGLTRLGSYAFYFCDGMKSAVSVPDGIAVLEERVFFFSGITELSLGKNVSAVGEKAFGRCTNLKKITVHPDNKTFSANGNCLVKVDTKTLVLGCAASSVPDDGSVTNIQATAFSCGELESFFIPSAVKKIDADSFEFTESIGRIYTDAAELPSGWKPDFGEAELVFNHAHDFESDCDETCDVCGYTRAVSHVYDGKTDADCNRCGTTREVAAAESSEDGVGQGSEDKNSSTVTIIVLGLGVFACLAAVLAVKRKKQ